MYAHISVIQLNVNHCAAAQSLLAQTAAERNVDIMLLSESYVTGTGPSSMILDESGRCPPWRRQSRPAGQAWDTRKIDEAMLAYQIKSLEIPNAESMAAGQTLRRIHAKKKEGTAQTTRVLVRTVYEPKAAPTTRRSWRLSEGNA
ncbi:GD10407 [Drosophila simulans]|uniref:GD10407 n=1 Tax=Drosophila simulans TaxID=7240 RepID=B4QD86_DROSI|nr:GD10407 [Drosophila simulans]